MVEAEDDVLVVAEDLGEDSGGNDSGGGSVGYR